jgi:hypothetical protein
VAEFRVDFSGRRSKPYETFEEARGAKRMEYIWGGRIGEIQERVGDKWVRTEDQRIWSDEARS